MAAKSKVASKPKTTRSKTKTTAAAKTNGGGKRDAQRERDLAQVGEVKELRKQDKTHAQIADQLKIQNTKALFLDIIGKVKPSQRIKNLTPEMVAELRNDEKLAWHVISARTFAAGAEHFVSVGKIKTMFKEETGKRAAGRLSKPKAKPAAKAKEEGKGSRPSKG